MLAAFLAPGRFFKGNVHGHSTNSDGRETPERACALYKQAGYDFIAVTDHFRPNYDFPITDTRGYRDETFTTLIGAELHAPQTSRGVDWHILAVGLPFDFAPPAPDETGPELAWRARNAGAFIGLAHPHWYQLTIEDGRALDAAHAVEVYNHTSQVHTERGDGLVMYDALLSEGKRLNALAVDDSHWKNDDAFAGWVMVKAEANTPEALLSALHAGAYYSTQGPEITDIRIDGDSLVVSCSPARAIMALGPTSDSRRVHAPADGPLLTEARLELAAFENNWCRVTVVDDRGRRAWSNPLWLK